MYQLLPPMSPRLTDLLGDPSNHLSYCSTLLDSQHLEISKLEELADPGQQLENQLEKQADPSSLQSRDEMTKTKILEARGMEMSWDIEALVDVTVPEALDGVLEARVVAP